MSFILAHEGSWPKNLNRLDEFARHMKYPEVDVDEARGLSEVDVCEAYGAPRGGWSQGIWGFSRLMVARNMGC